MTSRTTHLGLLAVAATCIAANLAGCGTEKSQGTQSTNTGGTAAATSTGGLDGGGDSGASISETGSGGSGGSAGATGGANATGGSADTAGGQAPTGGATATGGTAGGQMSTGGTPPTGGAANTTGGQAPTGGTTATGGVTDNTGGQAPTAGAEATGGQPSETGGTAGTGGGDFEGTMKIMALGDSITQSTCWRAKLWEKLDQSYSGRFDFVGTNSGPGCTPSGYDDAHQGWGSALITEIVAGVTDARQCSPNPCPSLSTLESAFSSAEPDVVLMHFGTNDVWNGKPPADILAAYDQVVAALRDVNPNVLVLVAQIIPMNVTASTCSGCSCSECPSRVQALNSAIATWAPGASTAASPVVVVDQWTDFSATSDTRDGVHPNDTTGSQKMADVWYAALESLF